jgi:hypothetical protein
VTFDVVDGPKGKQASNIQAAISERGLQRLWLGGLQPFSSWR